MNELVTLVAQRAGLNQETAQKAVETVIGVLNQTLPASIATHLGALLAGDVSGGDRQYGQRSGGNVEACNRHLLSNEIGRHTPLRRFSSKHVALRLHSRLVRCSPRHNAVRGRRILH